MKLYGTKQLTLKHHGEVHGDMGPESMGGSEAGKRQKRGLEKNTGILE